MNTLTFFNTNICLMTNKTKIYLIIAQRKVVSLKDLQDISRLNKMAIIKAVAPMLIKRKIRAVSQEGVRYFTIINKPL